MGVESCNINGDLNDAKFSQPMPWIGIYVAAASLACSIAMAIDAIRGFRYKKCWFPCKFFSLNATSLTLIAVAIKFSVDLNTVMPRCQDQLAKLSSSVFICTIMGNSMPSLGTMENQDILMNMVALGILVITLVVNICIQLGTGVIYVFWKEHVLVMFLMLVLLMILTFSALTIPITKCYMEHKYNKKYDIALKEGSRGTHQVPIKKLKQDLRKFWMMAHTCCPQFVIGRSATCTASGAFCLLAALTLGEAMARSYFTPWSFRFCHGESDYKWSTTFVLVAQTIAVVVGTIAPALRWFFAINFRCPKRGRESYMSEFVVERYWTQWLVEMKECPLSLKSIKSRHFRKLVLGAKNRFLDLCIKMQIGIVLASKAIRFISIFFIGRLFVHNGLFKGLRKLKSRNSISSSDSRAESQSEPKHDLSFFVLHLEGEDVLVELMKKKCDATDHWIQMGEKKQPNHLIKLLEESSPSRGFKGVEEFDDVQLPSLDFEEPPNCWALPLVTLTTIALSLPNIKPCKSKQLISSVNQGLHYVRLIEDSLDAEGDLKNSRNAANVVWLGVELYHKWLDVDLGKLALQESSSAQVLEGLAQTAKNKFEELKMIYMNDCLKVKSSKWPIKVLAANSMYRTSTTILKNHAQRNDLMSEKLFDELVAMICDVLSACLTNLQHVISIKCLSSKFEEREKGVWQAGFLLGQAKKIVEIVDRRSLPSLDPDQMVCIDNWRSTEKKHNPFPSTKPEIHATPSTANDLYLNVG